MAIDLLDFTQIDNDTPGVAWLALTTGQFFSTPPGGFVDIVDGTTAAARATEVIDAAYIVGGETAHVGLLRFFFSAGIQFIALRLAASSAEDGASAGPSLTADALNNLGLVVQRGTDTYKYRLVDLVGDAGDDDEPYSWSDVDPPLSLAALNALTGTDVHALLVDISNPRIDWPNLRLIDPAAVPAAPAAPTVTSTGMTSIRAAWTAPATGATPTGYDLQWRVAPNEAWTQVDDATSPHAIANLTVGATYEVQVRAYNDDGDGPWSASGQATTASANRTPTIAVINDVTVLQGEMLDLTLPDPGGDAPVALTVSGRPGWIQFDPSARRLHGTAANAVSEIPLTYTAEDADGETASRAFNVIVPLELGDFAPAGRDRAASALLTRGGVNTNGLLYRNDDPATDDPADLGELLAGSLTPDGQRISRIRRVDATHFQLIDTPDTTDLGAFFAAGGDGRDLRIHIQDKDGSAAFDAAAATISLTGANVVRFAATADFMTIVDRIAVNQRFILAFTRAAVADLPLTAAATLGGSLSVRAALALADVEDLALTAAVTLGGSLSVAASLTLADDDDLALTAAATLGGSLSVRAELALADVEDLALTAAPTLGGSLGVAASLTLAAVDDLALTAAATLGGSLSVRSVPTLADVEELALTAAVRLRGSLGVRAALTLTGGAPPPAVPVALLLSLETDMSDGLARGYPAEIPLHGDVVMEAWHPVEAEVETRLLRTVSDVAGPAVHGRVRSLVQEVITLLVPDAALAEQTARLLNAVNAGGARAWLRVQALGAKEVWRTPLRGGGLQLDGASLHYSGGKRRHRLRIIREPYFESAAAPVSLGAFALRSRTPIVLDAPAAGTLAAPLILTLNAANAVASTLRLHLYQDRNAPPAWTPGYVMAATGTAAGSGGHTQVQFDNPAPAGKGNDRKQLYQPLLLPASGASANVVRASRNADALGLGYGRAADDVNAEAEIAIVGRLGGQDSIFSGFGIAAVDEDVDFYLVTSYAGAVAGTGWRLVNAPADGYVAAEFSAGLPAGGRALQAGGGLALHGGPLFVAPLQRVALLPLIETVGANGAEYNGTALELEAALRPRVSEII